jgi:hypothetical protein
MAEKQVYRFVNHCQGKEEEQRAPDFRSQSLPWQRCSPGAQVAPQRCPILRSSAPILPCWFVFATGRFFVMNF